MNHVRASATGTRVMSGGHPTTRILIRMSSMVWFIAAVVLLSAQVSRAQPAAAPKKILVLYWYNKDFPANVAFDRSFQAVLNSAPPGSTEYYTEYVESNRFPGENQSQALHNYLQHKYADTLDVVVAVSDVSLGFLLKYRDDLFTRTPIVFLAIKRPAVNERATGPGLTGIIQGGEYKKTLDLALRLHPGTKQVFIISGTLSGDKLYEALCREELHDFDRGVSISYLTDLPVDQLIVSTKNLPQQSVVLYIWQQSKNEQGQILESRDVLASFAPSTTVPIYGVASWQVGRGIVGGYLRTFEADATRAGEIALRIANGARAQDIPIENARRIPIFDWREVKRWGIREDSLPPDSIVQFRKLSVWASYKWQIIGGTSLCLIEAFLIFALLAQRARRALAEKELRKSLSRIQSLAGRLIVAQEEERKHIARELHDDFNQDVAALAIGLGRLECQLPKTNSTVRAELRKLEDEATRLSDWVRTLSHQLHSAVLEHAGLVEALKVQCSNLKDQHGIAVSLNLNGDTEPLPRDVALCLYRVVQEALRNIAKHAGVKNAELSLAMRGESIELRIADQGAGFDASGQRREGLGLLSIEERVRFLGGEVEVRSRPGAGAELRVHIPVRGRP